MLQVSPNLTGQHIQVSPYAARYKLLNLRIEPDELPLLHPAMQTKVYRGDRLLSNLIGYRLKWAWLVQWVRRMPTDSGLQSPIASSTVRRTGLGNPTGLDSLFGGGIDALRGE